MTDWPFDPLRPLAYGAILADPPWAYQMRTEEGHKKSPEAHYGTMSIPAIKALPVDRLAGPDCLLFLWSTWPHLEDAMAVLRAWGFAYVTGGAWIKRTRNWKMTFGTGYVLRSASEPFLIGKIGAPKIVSRSERNVIDAPETVLEAELPDLLESVRREHSRKPPEMRDLIDRLLPHTYKAELFAREPWEGEAVWGNQVGKFSEAAT